MIRSSNIKIIGGFSIIALVMTAYLAVMGLSANRASAVAIHDFSQDVINNWHYVATTFNIPLENTKPGMLSPVIPERFSALDLAIYGFELVTPDFKREYQQLNMPRMTDRLHISTTDKGVLQYRVGGIQLMSIQDSGGNQGATFFMDVPKQLIDETSQMYDSVPMQGDRDGSGVVRYDRLDDGRYVMGMFLTYTQPAG
jgi:hypothetical protein